MAIQMRRGVFADFDTGKMIPGEFAVVLSGDATTSTGKGVYICFAAGDVQRLSTYEEIAASIQQALEDDEQFQQYVISAVEDTLEDHPEWTTTVQDYSISNVKLASNAVSATKIASNAVTNAKINNGAVSNDKIAGSTITESKFNSDITTFTEASSRENLTSGESIKTIWGKISKWFSDLKAVAFSGSYNDLTEKPTLGDAASKSVANNLTTASAGSAVLDAYQGKLINDVFTNMLKPSSGSIVTMSPGSGVTINRNRSYRIGNFVLLDVYLTLTSNKGSESSLLQLSNVSIPAVTDVPVHRVKGQGNYAAVFNASAVLSVNGETMPGPGGTDGGYIINAMVYAPATS